MLTAMNLVPKATRDQVTETVDRLACAAEDAKLTAQTVAVIAGMAVVLAAVAVVIALAAKGLE